MWRYNQRYRDHRSMFHRLLEEGQMSEATLLRSIRGAASRRQSADAAKRQATDDLRSFVRQAPERGVSITRIASEAVLSRQGVWDPLGGATSRIAESKSPLLGMGISSPFSVFWLCWAR